MSTTDQIVNRLGPFIIVRVHSSADSPRVAYTVKHEASGLRIAPNTSKGHALSLLNAINHISKDSGFDWSSIGQDGLRSLPIEVRMLPIRLAMKARESVFGAHK